MVPVDKTTQIQEIVHSKRGPPLRGAIERILRDPVRHIGQQGLKSLAWVVVEHPVLDPGQPSGN